MESQCRWCGCYEDIRTHCCLHHDVPPVDKIRNIPLFERIRDCQVSKHILQQHMCRVFISTTISILSAFTKDIHWTVPDNLVTGYVSSQFYRIHQWTETYNNTPYGWCDLKTPWKLTMDDKKEFLFDNKHTLAIYDLIHNCCDPAIIVACYLYIFKPGPDHTSHIRNAHFFKAPFN